ncbi:hypothetical protein PROFUN_06018 [Planoprotostelium fungivorum]|uniref:Major facilitator superfamily (MFS) profile domain-containing protein n=1 Tax=Planoprotostelium fungivorum TaxID=1890364 RepID=A0A2P6NPF3_9EUKA|nr:hypothetical protein PROFUN_06018 [Planoprotostelium fungivorum]
MMGREEEKSLLSDVYSSRSSYNSEGSHVQEEIDRVVHNLQDHPPQLYKRRWWVFFLFSMLGLMQNTIWMTYQPLVVPTHELFNTSSDMINWLAAQAALVFLFVLPFSTWMLDNLGLRNSVIIFGTIQAVGSGIRILGRDEHSFWWVFAGQVLNAIPGPIWSQAPTRVSNMWFSIKERTFVTFMTYMMLSLGVTVGFLESFAIKQAGDLIWLVVIHTAICALLMILVVFTFPSSPPTPPTVSSAIQTFHKEIHRTMWMDLKDCFTNASFLLIAVAVGVSQGCMFGWGAALDTNLTPLGYDENEIAWLGAAATLAGIVAGFFVLFVKKLKLAIVVLFFLGTAAFLSFQLFILRKSHSDWWYILVSGTVANLCLTCIGPLSFELSVELTFPVSEVISGGIITQVSNAATLVFLFSSNHIGGVIMNWVMFGASAAGFLLILFVKEQYKRIETDRQSERSDFIRIDTLVWSYPFVDTDVVNRCVTITRPKRRSKESSHSYPLANDYSHSREMRSRWLLKSSPYRRGVDPMYVTVTNISQCYIASTIRAAIDRRRDDLIIGSEGFTRLQSAVSLQFRLTNGCNEGGNAKTVDEENNNIGPFTVQIYLCNLLNQLLHSTYDWLWYG